MVTITYKRIETAILTTTIRVTADNVFQADAKVSVGSLSHVLEKEGVECLDKEAEDNTVIMQVDTKRFL